MSRYMQLAGGDHAEALRLYGQQSRVSAALSGTIGHVEVVVRNAMHDALSRHSQAWYDGLALLWNDQTRKDIETARGRAMERYSTRQITPGMLVSELNLGFWRFLLSKHYDRALWTPYLHRAFPLFSGPRSDLFDVMKRLNDDRNAVAHHQRVADALRSRQRGLRIAGYICPDARAWIASECGVSSSLEA